MSIVFSFIIRILYKILLSFLFLFSFFVYCPFSIFLFLQIFILFFGELKLEIVINIIIKCNLMQNKIRVIH